ncbi:MAG: trypsin-like serine protease [Deltaproteobacteria bacterium]|nr:trypsin-like serine protease [Deltaproteobacteria bacterium]
MRKHRYVARALALVLVLAAAGLGCGEAEESAPDATSHEDPLVGGVETFENEAVGVTTLDGQTGCSATLVRPNVILVAGHCFAPDRTDVRPWQFEIRKPGGAAHRYDTGDGWVKGRSAGADDVALLRLEQAVPASVASPIPIARRWPSYGTTLRLVGFGCIQRGGDGAGIKRKVDVSYGVTWDLGWVTKASCPGDSGGALLSTRGPELLGVISGFRASGYDLFGDAVAHREEIEAQIARLSR